MACLVICSACEAGDHERCSGAEAPQLGPGGEVLDGCQRVCVCPCRQATAADPPIQPPPTPDGEKEV